MMIFVCVVFALLSSCGTSEEILDNNIVDGDGKCRTTETKCGEGCCPYADAVCCGETRECCRPGSVCLEQLGLCIGVQSGHKGNSTPALFTERSTKLNGIRDCQVGTKDCGGYCCLDDQVCCSTSCCPPGSFCVESWKMCVNAQSGDTTPVLYKETPAKLRDVSKCPPYTTPCYTGCCPYAQGVCCVDRVHCCPSGYYCHGTYCMRGTVEAALLNVVLSPPPQMMRSAMQKPIQKKSPVTSKAGGPCCLTMFGFKCCPDFYICTQNGCFPNSQDPY